MVFTYSQPDVHWDNYNGGSGPFYNVPNNMWTLPMALIGPSGPATNAGADVTANKPYPLQSAIFDAQFICDTDALGFDEFVVYFSDTIYSPTDSEFGIRCSLLDGYVWGFIQEARYPNTSIFTQTHLFLNDSKRHTYYFVVKGQFVVIGCLDLHVSITMSTSALPQYPGHDFNTAPLYLVVGSHRYSGGAWGSATYQATVWPISVYPITVTGLTGVVPY
jgi:hypothetical protein